jgi:phage-related protein
MRAIFVGSTAYESACRNVNEAVADYTASVGDLGTAIGIALLLQNRQNEDFIEKQFGRLSLSTNTNFQTLKESALHGFNNIVQEIISICPCLIDATC